MSAPSSEWSPSLSVDAHSPLLPLDAHHVALADRIRAHHWTDLSHAIITVDIANCASQSVDVAIACSETLSEEKGEKVQLAMQLRPQAVKRYDLYIICMRYADYYIHL